MGACHDSNIFCLAFNHSTSRVLSGANDHQILYHDLETGRALDVWSQTDAVYTLSVNPNDENVFVTACEDGSISMRDVRLADDDSSYIAKNCPPFQCAMYNPADSRLIASTNTQDGLQLWDSRTPNKPLLNYSAMCGGRSRAMSARWSWDGLRIMALRRRMTPALYNVWSRQPVMGKCEPSPMKNTNIVRPVYTHEEYISMVLRGGGLVGSEGSGTTQNMEEDTRMMAFFDSLVQREIDEMSEENSLSDDSETSAVSDTAQMHLITDLIESGRRVRSISDIYSDEVVDVNSPSPPSVDPHVDDDQSPSTSGIGASNTESSEMGETASEMLDSSLGYNEHNRDAVRDVTQLVIRKRQKMDMIQHKLDVKKSKKAEEASATSCVEARRRVKSCTLRQRSIRDTRLGRIRRLMLLGADAAFELDAEPNAPGSPVESPAAPVHPDPDQPDTDEPEAQESDGHAFRRHSARGRRNYRNRNREME